MLCKATEADLEQMVAFRHITFISSRRSGAERKLLSAAVFSPFSIAYYCLF